MGGALVLRCSASPGSNPGELRHLILKEATGGRATTLDEIVAGDQTPVRTVFRRWKTHTDLAIQAAGAEE
jgi:hypothetical protein